MAGRNFAQLYGPSSVKILVLIFTSGSTHVRGSHRTLSPPVLHSPPLTIASILSDAGMQRHARWRRRHEHAASPPPANLPSPHLSHASPPASLPHLASGELLERRHQTLIALGSLDLLQRPPAGEARRWLCSHSGYPGRRGASRRARLAPF